MWCPVEASSERQLQPELDDSVRINGGERIVGAAGHRKREAALSGQNRVDGPTVQELAQDPARLRPGYLPHRRELEVIRDVILREAVLKPAGEGVCSADVIER